MALQNFNAKLVTDQGVIYNGAFGDTSAITPPWQLNTTWDQFVTRSQYNGGLFNLTWALDKPAGTYTQTITLKNGNYAVETVTISVSGDSYTTTLDVKLYRADNTLLRDICDFSSGVTHGRNDHCIVVVMYDDTNNHWVNVVCYTNNRESHVYIQANETSSSYADYIGWMLGSIAPDNPYGFIPESEPNDGLGNADYSNDDTDYSGLPALSSSQVGFCSLYKMNQQQMADLADYLWGLSQGTLATFLPIFSNPMDCIIAVGIVPVNPETESQADLIKVGNLTTTVWGFRITKQYDEIDMGEVEIGKGDYTNSFMDYSPYTKVELYLPYIGNVSLDTDEVMDSTIGVKYKFDLLSGSCVAEVKVTKTYNYQNEDHVHSNILYRYSGNFLANIPINGENFSQMFNAVIGAVAMGINAAGNYKTGIASADMAKSADVSAARSDAASLHRSAAAFNGVGATSAMKPSIQRAGNVSSVCGFLSKQKPEIILKLPKIANIGENQGHEVGYPRYGEYTIAELEGYSSIMMIHLKNIPCTDTERELIERDLNSGVIFSKTAVPQHSEFQNTVKVYKFKCENICVNKADDWELIDTLTLSWRNPNIDVLNPTIRIEATTNLTKRRILREGNYVYIADFERYYYVKSMKAQAGNFIELELAVDACMSWLTNLRNQQCVVDRQEKVWNTYLNDEFMRVYNTPYTVVKEFPNGFDTQNFVLAVAGGGSTSSSSGDDSGDDGGGSGHDF